MEGEEDSDSNLYGHKWSRGTDWVGGQPWKDEIRGRTQRQGEQSGLRLGLCQVTRMRSWGMN